MSPCLSHHIANPRGTSTVCGSSLHLYDVICIVSAHNPLNRGKGKKSLNGNSQPLLLPRLKTSESTVLKYV